MQLVLAWILPLHSGTAGGVVVQFNTEAPPKWLLDMTPHVTDVHHVGPPIQIQTHMGLYVCLNIWYLSKQQKREPGFGPYVSLLGCLVRIDRLRWLRYVSCPIQGRRSSTKRTPLLQKGLAQKQRARVTQALILGSITKVPFWYNSLPETMNLQLFGRHTLGGQQTVWPLFLDKQLDRK